VLYLLFPCTEPFFFKQHGFDVEQALLKTLVAKDFPRRDQPFFDRFVDGPQPLVMQCFDHTTLKSLCEKAPFLPRIQLLNGPTEDDDSIAWHLGRVITYGPDLSLNDISAYAQGIGPQKNVYTSDKLTARALVDEAHDCGLAGELLLKNNRAVIVSVTSLIFARIATSTLHSHRMIK